MEGIEMPYTVEDFEREVREDIIKRVLRNERLGGISLRELFLGGLSPEERLEGLSPEQIEAYLAKLRQHGSSPPAEKATEGGQQTAPQPARKKGKSKRKP